MNSPRHLQVIAWLLTLLFSPAENLSAQVGQTGTADIAARPVLQPTDAVIQQDRLPIQQTGGLSTQPDAGFSAEKLQKLMRPTFDLQADWYAKADRVDLATYKAGLTIPTYPFLGPPPPMLKLGFAFTDLDSPSAVDLPNELYESSVGVSWMRRKSERWMFRSMIGVAHASDGNNNSSDSWQFRGGVFAMYVPRQEWIWTFGAIALGRKDIPVVPAIGLILQPNRSVRFDLMFPKPKAAVLLADNGMRQIWGYIGGGLNGGTWAYERAGGTDDQLTYRDWQVVIGIESTPRPEPGMPFTRGRKLGAEIGYAFSREFEFEGDRADIRIGDTIMLRGVMSF